MSRPHPYASVEAGVRSIAGTVVRIADVPRQATFEDIRLDSLDLVDLVMSIEDEFGIEEIDVDEMLALTGIPDTVALVERKLVATAAGARAA